MAASAGSAGTPPQAWLTRPVASFFPGLRLGERYVLDQLIGSGGMSQVWRAVDEVLGRTVAVKTLEVSLNGDPALRAAIRHEARAAASIAHPHVTQVYDFGETAVLGGGGAAVLDRDGAAVLDRGGSMVPYLVMELLDGENLADRLGRGPLPWPEAVAVCAEVAAALAAAHRLGVVHRDIKPANVMLTAAGAKVVDFGIAALTEGRDPVHPPRAGTPAYLAPEILLGAPGTPESDVYGLGALLHAALTGSAPVAVITWSEATEAHERGLAAPPVAVPGLPDDVRELCARCLSPSPGSRPTCAEAASLLAALAVPPARPARHAQPDQPVQPVQPVPPPQPSQPGRGVGRAVVPTPAAAAAPNPTLLDSTPVRPAARRAGHPQPQGALVAPARRPGRVPLALLATAAALAGLFVLVGAAAVLSGQRGDVSAGTANPDASTVPGPSPTPRDPQTPAAVIIAINAEIANAIVGGRLGRDVALDLVDDVKEIERRLVDGKDRDVRRRAENLRDRLDERVADGEVDDRLAARLDRLLDILIRLSGGS